MNIFVVHYNPATAAQMLCDKHVVKMALETAQLLCSAFENGTAPYKRTHYNHPCAKWARELAGNYLWLVQHGLALCVEYQYRYNKEHKCKSVIQWCFDNMHLIKFQKDDYYRVTPFPQAMPDKYKNIDAVKAYRAYYNGEKLKFAKYTKREKPEWVLDCCS